MCADAAGELDDGFTFDGFSDPMFDSCVGAFSADVNKADWYCMLCNELAVQYCNRVTTYVNAESPMFVAAAAVACPADSETLSASAVSASVPGVSSAAA